MKPLLVLLLFFCVISDCHTQAKKVLIVSTNIDTLQNQPNGTFLMEIAYPIAAFTKAGIEVDILTAKGGKAATYYQGTLAPELAVIQQSALFINKTTHSIAPHQVRSADYGGIFYPGGGGQFYDVVNNDSIARIAAAIYENGGVVGTAGHGAVSLINIQLSDKSFFVKDKTITCFPRYASAKWLPIDWETALRSKGATVVFPVTPEEKDKGVQLADKNTRVISGSYAENAGWVATQMSTFIKK